MNRVEMMMESVEDWNTPEKAREFFQLLVSEDAVFVPAKYDRREPERFAFDAQNITVAVDAWISSRPFLFMKRRKPFSMLWIIEWWHYENRLFNSVTAALDQRYFASNERVNKLLSLAKRVYLWGPMMHGRVCHDSDWEAKNRFDVPTRIASGRAVSTGGLDLRDGLPGIYWANFFGPIYVDFFGRRKFETVPAYDKEELPDGGFLVLTAASPLDYGRPEVRKLESAIVDHLGRDAFFEKTRPEKRCRAPVFEFRQAPLGHPIELVSHDPVSEVIPDPHGFIRHAPDIAASLVNRFEGKLDYRPDSLTLMDDFILRKSYRRPEPWTRGEEGRRLMQELTAYYGEVLRRNLQGQWVVQEGSGSPAHPAVVFTVGGLRQVEYPFARVVKLWEERVRADGLAIRFMLLKSGQWARLQQHLKGQE